MSKIWNVPVYEGEEPINDDMQIDFAIDMDLLRFKDKPPPDDPGFSDQEDVNGISGITPTILTNLNNRVGFASGTGVDVNLICEDIAGVVRYEIRIVPA